MHYYLALKTFNAQTMHIAVREFGTPWERDSAIDMLKAFSYQHGSFYEFDHTKPLPDMIDWMKDKVSRVEHPQIKCIVEAG